MHWLAAWYDNNLNPLLAALLEPSLEKRLVEHSVRKREEEGRGSISVNWVE